MSELFATPGKIFYCKSSMRVFVVGDFPPRHDPKIGGDWVACAVYIYSTRSGELVRDDINEWGVKFLNGLRTDTHAIPHHSLRQQINELKLRKEEIAREVTIEMMARKLEKIS